MTESSKNPLPIRQLSASMAYIKGGSVGYAINLSVSQLVIVVFGCIVLSFSVGQTCQGYGILKGYAVAVQRTLGVSVVDTSFAWDNSHSEISTALKVVQAYSNSNVQCVTVPSLFHPVNSHSTTNEKMANTTCDVTIQDDLKQVEMHSQQLLVEIENLDRDVLHSRVLLTSALVQLSNHVQQRVLSYDCNEIQPEGFSCVGILQHGHITFHTWPREGVILLDVFAFGTYSLLELVPFINALFVVKGADTALEPHLVWRHKRRGFHDSSDGDVNPEECDMGSILGSREYAKDFIASVETNFQRIDIMDLRNPKFEAYSSVGSEFVKTRSAQKDRVIFLDGVMQSRSEGEAAYHEALVHPAMFTHHNPKRVAIIGGGEGATLREVLKHSTLEKVVMIEIDEMMVNVSRTYLPEWSDCSSLNGVYQSCFDDPRAELFFNDSLKWFMDRFGTKTVSDDEKFDVIIFDALDPNSVVPFSDLLYDNEDFIGALSNALGECGILAAQLGESDKSFDPPSSYRGELKDAFIRNLIHEGIQNVAIYEESHGRFTAPWKFLVAMKEKRSLSRWIMSEAELQLSMQHRVTKDNQFKYFDGAIMQNYDFPSRVVEDSWCVDNPDDCGSGHGFNPEISDVPRSFFDVGISNVAKGGRGVFASDFIQSGSFIGLEECVNGMFVPPKTFEVLRSSIEYFRDIEYYDCLGNGYLDGYGWIDNDYGDPSAGVDPGIFTFINHGCNGKYNVGAELNVTESTVELGTGSERFYNDGQDQPYQPFLRRHFPNWGCEELIALRDIDKGEELFDNYLVHGGKTRWEKNLMELKDLCSGGIGSVSQYEQNKVEMAGH